MLLALLAADIAGTVLTLCGVRSSLPPLENLNSRLAALSVRLGEWILRRAEGRIQKAHPGAVFSRRREKTTVSPFARGPAFTAFCSCSLLAEWPVIRPKPSSAASKWAGG